LGHGKATLDSFAVELAVMLAQFVRQPVEPSHENNDVERFESAGNFDSLEPTLLATALRHVQISPF